jgi:hypothetical protein
MAMPRVINNMLLLTLSVKYEVGNELASMVLTFILLQQLFSIRKMILEPTPSKQWMILEH